LLSSPRKALADLSCKEERDLVRLFEEMTQDFVAFQEDIERVFTDL
jgi:hypothetical protein